MKKNMNLFSRMFQPRYKALAIFLGFVAMIIAAMVTPAFAARYLSQDHHLSPETIELLNTYRFILSLAGVLFIVIGSIGGPILRFVKKLVEKIQLLNNYFDRLLESKILSGLIFILVLCFSLLRFVNIDADFPPTSTHAP